MFQNSYSALFVQKITQYMQLFFRLVLYGKLHRPQSVSDPI